MIGLTARRGGTGLVLEERAREVDVVERVGDRALRLRVDEGLHTRHAVVRHLLREVL